MGSWTPPLSPLHHPPLLLAALVGWKDPKMGRCLKCPCGCRSRAGTSSRFTAFCSWQHWGFLGFVGAFWVFFFPYHRNDLPIQSQRKNCKKTQQSSGHIYTWRRGLYLPSATIVETVSPVLPWQIFVSLSSKEQHKLNIKENFKKLPYN